MGWFYLLIAGILEIIWAIGLKYSQGFSRPLPASITIIAFILSFIFLSISIKTIPIGTGYAVWTGIGAAGTAALGIVLFNEPREIGRLVSIIIIICGIAGLKIFSK